jgi:putative oxidoreductase
MFAGMIDRALLAAPLVGRILLSAIFLMSGAQKLMNWEQTAQQMEGRGMVAVQLFLVGAVLFELGGGLSVLTGYWARLGALALIVFLIPTTFIFHNYWTYGGQEQMNQMAHFMKNLAILGGLFMVLGLGSGCCSLDRRGATKLRVDG